MKKFSSNYAYTNHNYVIQNLDDDYVKGNIYYSTICVIKNIIQRGKPTILSSYLQKEIGAIHKDENFTKYLPLIDNKTPVWHRIIKGDTENNYIPAKIFFEKLIPEEIKYIQNLLLPECRIEDITQEIGKGFEKQQVDFYLPQAFLVIEIDGSQHKEQQQKILDLKRDKYLDTKGIKVIRITTEEINNKNIESKLEQIKNILRDKYKDEHNKTKDYYFAYKNGINLDNKFYLATAINRFQILTLELLACKKLNFKNDWNIEIISDKGLDKRFAELAVKDLFEWFKKLFALQKIDFVPPEYNIKFVENFSNSNNSIKIDFSLLKRYTDENQTNPNIIYVRTDYFDQYIYIPKSSGNDIKKMEYRDYDYFKVSIANSINYSVDISDKNTEKILFSLAWDLFLQNNNDLSFETTTFREGQLDIIVNALQKKDTIGLLPTGSGKSLCYQLVCLLQPAISFVVCPLKSLMRDQTDELNNNFITRINFISSDCSAEERVKILKDYIDGKYIFVLISPERFQTKEFRNTLPANVAYAVIDEVHCLSEWGHDFRTAYLNLVPAIKNQCKNITFMALTATASLNVIKDIKIELNITDDNNIKTPKYYSREELEFIIWKCDIKNKKNELKELITTIKKDKFYKYGIVFTATVSQSKHLGGCKDLSESFYYKFPNDNVRYISGNPPEKMTDEQKEKFNEYKIKTQNMFKKGEIKLLFATKSFGMGINKTDIAYTIHYSIPSSMESLYQQAGRAGRSKMLFNKKKAKCYILFSAENLNQENLNKLWDRNSDYNIIKTNNDKLTADLASQVYFFCNSNESIDEGYEQLKILKEYICENIDEQNIFYLLKEDKNDMQGIDEKFIMKMKQLGIVEDWLVDFERKQCKLILNEHFKFLYKEKREKIENFIEDNIEAIIRKYDKEFRFSNLNNSDDERYINFKKYNNIQDYFEKYVKILLQWNYDNFGYNRRQALKTLYETCIEISKKEDKKVSHEFKERLENYFKFSNKTNILQFIADHPLKHKKWFDIFYKYEDAIKTNKIIDKQEVKSLIDNLARILESYKQNTGLDFISGLLRLFYNDYSNSDGRNRFESSLKQIKTFEQNIQKDIFEQLFKIVDMYELENKNREELSESIINICSNDLEFIKYVYSNLKDDYSLSCILDNHLSKLKNVKNKIEV